jgi:hypothetical protein
MRALWRCEVLHTKLLVIHHSSPTGQNKKKQSSIDRNATHFGARVSHCASNDCISFYCGKVHGKTAWPQQDGWVVRHCHFDGGQQLVSSVLGRRR